MTTTTVKQAREAVEAAQLAYLAADINHPTQLILTKQELTQARHEYWNACANFCTKLEFSVDLAEVHENLIIQGLWV